MTASSVLAERMKMISRWHWLNAWAANYVRWYSMCQWFGRLGVNGRFMKPVGLQRPHLSDLERLGLPAALLQQTLPLSVGFASDCRKKGSQTWFKYKGWDLALVGISGCFQAVRSHKHFLSQRRCSRLSRLALRPKQSSNNTPAMHCGKNG